jgi:hypothetical protein
MTSWCWWRWVFSIAGLGMIHPWWKLSILNSSHHPLPPKPLSLLTPLPFLLTITTQQISPTLSSIEQPLSFAHNCMDQDFGMDTVRTPETAPCCLSETLADKIQRLKVAWWLEATIMKKLVHSHVWHLGWENLNTGVADCRTYLESLHVAWVSHSTTVNREGRVDLLSQYSQEQVPAHKVRTVVTFCGLSLEVTQCHFHYWLWASWKFA